MLAYGLANVFRHALYKPALKVFFRIKGRESPLAIYEPLGLRSEIDPQQLDELARFEQVLGHYRQQLWDQAKAGLDWLQQLHPEQRLYALYRERIDYFSQHPPGSEWDGVFNFQTKK